MFEYVVYVKISYVSILYKCNFEICRANDLLPHLPPRPKLSVPMLSELLNLFLLLTNAILKQRNMNSGKQLGRERFAGMIGPEGKDFGNMLDIFCLVDIIISN